MEKHSFAAASLFKISLQDAEEIRENGLPADIFVSIAMAEKW